MLQTPWVYLHNALHAQGDRARGHQPTGMDSLINDMGELQIGQEATLQLALQNGQHIRRVREEDAQRWAGWYQNFPPPQ